ncbi:MAG TPA: M43 family zinc metalloprotease [Flavobacterium sp.]|uniref:M43 family zinc metalloprotease n=1 Tax=unclassified Flavobacterium TaxID=196869 RepID=UPI000E7D4991|nr:MULTISPECIES: M43 family zinc metalloprotease [unclassified Flavobacterium]HBI02293.1 hypothetical protein [Flavobacterium sp.]HRE77541.1 M43 family zinc metalloprotease [Flavobacterium sp.]
MNKNFTSTLFFLSFVLFSHFSVIGQNNGNAIQFGKSKLEKIKCATTENEQKLRELYPNRNSDTQFENWLAPKIEAIKANRLASRQNDNSILNVITIPVVVHVIHNGDGLGVNENITDAQILSQIAVLNQDFGRIAGTPGFNTNPVGVDTEIQFCMAQRDPNGLFTTGINRYNLGSEASWEMDEINEEIKPQTQWNPNEYLNIWVVNKVALKFFGFEIGEILGYAQFPSGSGLEGLEEGTGPANTDGVVIGHRYFGSSDIYPAGTYFAPNDKGRTTTHEVGHYLGLRHIWGDGNCDADDYCEDTPRASAANSGCSVGMDSCPSFPGLDMVENYMDYSDDACMNVFTQDQKDRMTAVLTNAQRRATLGASLGCQPGQTYDNDGSLDILDLNLAECGTTLSPSLRLTNIGNNTISSAEITYNTDGNNDLTFNWNGTLTNGQNAIINLPSLTTNAGNNTFNASVTSVNGVNDDNELNSTKSQNFDVVLANTEQITITILTDDYGDETTWVLLDSNNNEIASGGPYEDNTEYNETIAVLDNECYTFTIFDEFEDGICCEYGIGIYEIKTFENEIIVSGGEFGASESRTFGIDQNLSTNENSFSNGIKIYPNPVSSQLNITISDEIGLPNQFTVYNSLGQIIENKKVNSNSDLTVNTATYSSGVYFIKIIKEDQSTVIRFIKN